MGISKFIKNKLHESQENRKAEKAYHKEQELNERHEYNRGRIEGQHKRGILEGAGGVTAQEKFAARTSGRSRGVQRVSGTGKFSASMQNFDNIFGASNFSGGGSKGGGGGMGMGLGFGGGEGRARPDRVVTKANGKVRIEEYGSRHESNDGFGELGLGGGLGLDGFGGSGGSSGKKGKREPHPYEF